ncbi:PREDICTED: uncharacterized protein LOC104610872 isoform X2 [Nelumbo nucifera]|nr:PREDICTED: uncharacterized protein LOC104610872 isoform X2 [Nelumbo nucifera]DAD20554.1 TPA_asm: hypothetical protein HUJ06_022017 [Nelumbo nucifera]
MHNSGNLREDEVTSAVIAACSAGMLSMLAWYLIGEHSQELETDGESMLVDEGIDIDDIEEGIEASSEQTRVQSNSLSHPKEPINKFHAPNIISTMNTLAANLGRIAEALDRSNKAMSIDYLYEEVTKIQDFDEDFVIEALEYLASDDKKGRTFLTLDEKRRKNWLLRNLRGRRG